MAFPRIIFCFTVFALLVSFAAKAQTEVQLLVSDTEGKPIEQALCKIATLNGATILSGITNKEGILTFTTNYSGQVVLGIQHISYQTFADTVSIQSIINATLQPGVFNLEEMVVTAQYSPGSSDKSVHQVKVISSEQIQNMAAVNLQDVLAYSVNIRLTQDNVLGAGMSMQGISGQNVKIMIDGVPVIGRLDGNIDLSQLNLNDVERIEIVEGPLSVNYGTNALAGTINIITKKGSVDKQSGTATMYFENIGTHNIMANTATKILKTNTRLSVGRNWFDGWSPNDPTWPSYKPTLADSGRYKQWKPKEQYFARLNADRTIAGWNANFRYEFFNENILNRGLPRPPFGETAFDDTYKTRRHDESLILSKSFKTHRIDITSAHNHYKREKNTYLNDLTTLHRLLSTNPDDQDNSRFEQVMSRGIMSSTRKSSRINYQLGYDLNQQWAFGKRIESGVATMGDYSLFGSAEIYLRHNLVVKPALRATKNTVYKAPLTPSFNFKWNKNNWTLRGSYARGFRAPTLKEMYFLFFDINHNIVGNTSLLAERSHNVTTNLQYQKIIGSSAIKLNAGTYYNNIDNMITLAQIKGQQYSYVNVGTFVSKGFKVESQWISGPLKIDIIYNRLGRQSLNPEGNKAFFYSNEVSANAQRTFSKQKITLSLFYKYQGKLQSYSVDAGGQVSNQFIKSYQMCDATLGKSLAKEHIRLTLGVKNLFNVQNVNAAVAGGIHTGASNSVSVGTGRCYFGKMQIQF
ncbi:TonB-dependent receptor [bacterium]|nr:TonB-dependent receptor [bacterium]